VRRVARDKEWNVVLFHQNAPIGAADFERIICGVSRRAKEYRN
jgi:hypothetical protein